MIKLKDFIYSLATLIIRYHDSQPKVNKLVVETDPIVNRKKSREQAIAIMQNQETKYDQKLKTLIEACTKIYPDRKHFLAFIVHEISFLKGQLERPVAYNLEELAQFQTQVTQLLIDFKRLLHIPKDAVYTVTNSTLNGKDSNCVDLSGLVNNAWVGNTFCNSGLLLVEEVLARFHLTPNASNEELDDIAHGLCMENQNMLLVTELHTHKLDLEAQKLALSIQNQNNLKTISELQSDLENTKHNLEQQQVVYAQQIEEQQSIITGLKNTLEHTKAELDVQKIIQSQQQTTQSETIDNLRSELQKVKTVLQKTQAELQSEKNKTLPKSNQPSYPSFARSLPYNPILGLGVINPATRPSSNPGLFSNTTSTTQTTQPATMQTEEPELHFTLW